MALLSLVFYIVALTAHSALALPMMRTAPMECPLENGNLLDVHLFISDEVQCKQLCQANEVRHASNGVCKYMSGKLDWIH
jgi:hypothetical protein